MKKSQGEMVSCFNCSGTPRIAVGKLKGETSNRAFWACPKCGYLIRMFCTPEEGAEMLAQAKAERLAAEIAREQAAA